MRKNAKVSGSQTPMEARMQNESYPRRNDRRSALRRGSRRAGRIGRAKGKRGRSFRGLQMAVGEIECTNYRARGNRSAGDVLNFFYELWARQHKARFPSRHHAFSRANKASERFLRQIVIAPVSRDRMLHTQQVSQLATFGKGLCVNLSRRIRRPSGLKLHYEQH